MVFFRYLRHTHRHLAVNALAVDAPFARHYQRAVVDMLLEIERLGNNFNATAQFRTEKRHQRRPHATRRARPRNTLHIDMQIFFDHLGKVIQAAIQFDDHRFRRPLLRAEYTGCAARAGERVGHIAGHADCTLLQARIEAREINMIEADQATAAVTNLFAVGHKTRTQRLPHTGPAVVSGTAADADDNVARALIQRLQNKLPGAARRGN